MIRSLDDPLIAEAGIAVLRGNLCPQGAVVKPSAASPELLVHTGPAFVFDSIEDFKARIDDPDLDVTPDSVLVLRGCGPRGYPGMPEVGNMPLPARLLTAGVRDMVRISDATNEWDGLRHDRAARGAGVGGWRATGRRADG